jgi:hypothetical protein
MTEKQPKKFSGPVKPGERRNPYGCKGKPKEPEREEADGLGDGARMRAVYEQGAGEDRNSAQRMLRGLMLDDFKGFYKLMLELEREERGAAVVEAGVPHDAPVPAVALPSDEAEERVLRLCEELLRRASHARA